MPRFKIIGYIFVGILLIAFGFLMLNILVRFLKYSIEGRFYPSFILLFVTLIFSGITRHFNTYSKNRKLKVTKLTLWGITISFFLITLTINFGIYTMIGFVLVSLTIVALRKKIIHKAIPDKFSITRILPSLPAFGKINIKITRDGEVHIKHGFKNFRLVYIGIDSLNEFYMNFEDILNSLYKSGVEFNLEISQINGSIYTYISLDMEKATEDSSLGMVSQTLKKNNISIKNVQNELDLLFATYTPIVGNYILENAVDKLPTHIPNTKLVIGERNIFSIFEELDSLPANFHLIIKFIPTGQEELLKKRQELISKTKELFKQQDINDELSLLALIDRETLAELININDLKAELENILKSEKEGRWKTHWLLIYDLSNNDSEDAIIDHNALLDKDLSLIITRAFHDKNSIKYTTQKVKEKVMKFISYYAMTISKD